MSNVEHLGKGGGESSELRSSTGNSASWPTMLKTALSIVLPSEWPMVLVWGTERLTYYNNAFRQWLIGNVRNQREPALPFNDSWPQGWPNIENSINRAFSGESLSPEHILVPAQFTQKNDNLILRLTYNVIYDEAGTIAGVTVSCNRITRPDEATEKLNIVLEASRLGTFELDFVTNDFSYSTRFREIFGYTGNDTPPHEYFVRCVHPDDLKKRAAAYEEAFQTGRLHYQTRIIWPDGSLHWIEGSGKIFFDQQQRPLKMIGTLRDLTDEKQAEQILEESERKFRNTVMQLPLGIAVFRGREFITEMVNAAYLAFTQRAEEEFIGRPLFETVPEVRSSVEDLMLKVYETGEPFYGNEFEAPLIRNGKKETAYFNFVYHALRDVNNEIWGLVVVASEVTKQVLAKHRLEESETQFRKLVTNSPIAMTIWRGKDYIIEMANTAMFKNIWRKEPHEVMGKKALEVFPELLEQKFPELLAKVLTDGVIHRENEARALVMGNDGMKEFFLDFEYAPLLEKDNQTPSGIMITVYDVTDRVRARQKREEAEDKFRALTSLMPQLIWTSDAQGNINSYSPSVYDYSGLSFEDLEVDGWVKMTAPEDREDNYRAWMKSITTGNDYLYQHRLRRHDGEMRWHLSRAVAQRNENGEIQMWVGTSTDIHEQKKFSEELEKQVHERTHELLTSNEQLSKSNADLEQFAYIASHDLQEPLRKIKTFISILENSFDDPTERTKYFNKINVAANRMSTLIRNVLEFSRLRKAEDGFSKTDLQQIFEEIQFDFELYIQERGARVHVGPLPIVNGIPHQLRQLFFNLINNSLKFSTNTPVIHVTGRVLTREEAMKYARLDPEHQYAQISIKDNGIGFEQKFADQIFTIFQRLNAKKTYEGTGIGLALCKKIAENHDGMITAESVPGEGSTFYVFLRTD
jgi:PAS domain S-box-containing protein